MIDAITKNDGDYASVDHVLPALVMGHRAAQSATERLISAGDAIEVEDLATIRECMVDRLYLAKGCYTRVLAGAAIPPGVARFVPYGQRGSWSLAGVRRMRVSRELQGERSDDEVR
jgi:hypothetical protein